MSDIINEFKKDHRFLSNFFPSPIRTRNVGTDKPLIAPTAEHLYQALKSLNPEEQQLIINCETPGQAKHTGRNITLRSGWESIKTTVMEMIIHAKFDQNLDLADKLLSTGEATLIEGNYWNDKLWGVCLKTNEGQNLLGKILMNERQLIKENR